MLLRCLLVMPPRKLILLLALATIAAKPAHDHVRPASLPVPPIPPAHPPPDPNAPVPNPDILPPLEAEAGRRVFLQTSPDPGKFAISEGFLAGSQYRARPGGLMPMLGLGMRIPLH